MKYLDYVSIDSIKNLSKGHFFDKGSMRLFNSRLAREGYRFVSPEGASPFIFFVTSEQFDYKTPRLYTVRRLNVVSGDISTVGDFQQYKSSSGANNAAKKMAMNN